MRDIIEIAIYIYDLFVRQTSVKTYQSHRKQSIRWLSSRPFLSTAVISLHQILLCKFPAPKPFSRVAKAMLLLKRQPAVTPPTKQSIRRIQLLACCHCKGSRRSPSTCAIREGAIRSHPPVYQNQISASVILWQH